MLNDKMFSQFSILELIDRYTSYIVWFHILFSFTNCNFTIKFLVLLVFENVLKLGRPLLKLDRSLLKLGRPLFKHEMYMQIYFV